MTDNFHGPISNALHSKAKRKKQESNSQPANEVPQAPQELESRLDKMITSDNKQPEEVIVENTKQDEHTLSPEMKALFHSAENISQSISYFIAHLKQNNLAKEIQELKENYTQRIHAQDYLDIKNEVTALLSKEIYHESDDLITKLIHYVKMSAMLSLEENIAIIKYLQEDNTLSAPYTFLTLSKICEQLNAILNQVSSKVRKKYRTVIYTLVMNANLIYQEEECKKLTLVNLTELNDNFFKLLEKSENKELQRFFQEISELNKNIEDYQNLLHHYAKERRNFAVTNDVFLVKKLHTLHLKLAPYSDLEPNVLTLEKQLQNAINDFPENIKEHISDINKNFAQLVSALKEVQLSLNNLRKQKFDAKYQLLMRLIKGDFFNEQEHDNLHMATYTFHSLFNPIELLNGIIKHFPQYTQEMQQECLFFLKNFLTLDTNHALIGEKGKSSEFIDKVEIISEAALNLVPDDQSIKNTVQDISNVIENKMRNKKQAIHPPSPPAHYELVKLFDNIAHNTASVIEYEKSLETFVDTIRLDFTALFSRVDLSELRDLAWKKDKINIENGFPVQAPNVRKFFQHHQRLVKFFGLAVLYDFSKITLAPRESIFEIKRIHEFIEHAIHAAIEKGAVSTMISLELALRNPAVARLNLSKPGLLELRIKYFNDLKSNQALLGQLMQEKDSVPFLPLALKEMAAEYNEKHLNEFEHRVSIGKKLNIMYDKIQIAKSRSTSLSDIGSQITSILQSYQLLSPPILPDDILLNENKIYEVTLEASEYIKPKEFKSYQITDFQSLADLKKHLIYCQRRMEDFHLIEKNPEKAMMEFLLAQAKDDSTLLQFQDSLQILDLMGQINLSLNREYKNYESYLAQTLSAYEDNASALLKDKKEEHSHALEHFFTVYMKYKKIKAFRESQVSTLNPFSVKHHLKESIAALDKHLRHYKKLLAVSKEQERQQNYSELLIKVLEGDKQDPIIHFGPAQQSETQTSIHLLPDTEFPVPQAEPEHPDYIGINRTMNFNPDTQQRSIFELFETIELKNDFRSAFPWSADIDSTYKLEKAKTDPSLNLLVTDHLIDPEIQIAVIDFILISLDILGKIAGFNGDLAIRNFATIKNVTDGMQDITESLSTPLFDEAKFQAHLNERTLTLNDLNHDLSEMINSSDPLNPAQKNPVMNEFCHINEYLTHQLMGIPYQKSVLSPLTPDSPLFKKISESLKRELLQKDISSEIDTED